MFQDEDDYDMYRKLWRLRPIDVWKPSTDGSAIARVEYHCGDDFPIGPEAGLFFVERGTDGSWQPVIWIRREQPPEDPSEPDVAGANELELVTLAHERGHEASWRAGTYKAMTMLEERRAWEHAERILKALGLNEWWFFEAQRTHSLQAHAQSGTPEDRPG